MSILVSLAKYSEFRNGIYPSGKGVLVLYNGGNTESELFYNVDISARPREREDFSLQLVGRNRPYCSHFFRFSGGALPFRLG